MDKGLIGVMVTIAVLFVIGFISEAYAKHQARRQALKLLGSRRLLEYEIERSVRAQRESLRARAQSTGIIVSKNEVDHG
ncbi:MAG: hypothetical protein ABI036_14150 [Fibrobacteria bacterium]